MEYVVTGELVQAIVNVLDKLPYHQVYQVMAQIMVLQPAEIKKEIKDDREKTVAV